MSQILPLRDLGDFGVNTDVDQSALDKCLFSSGINFQLTDGKINTFNGGTIIATPTAPFNAGLINHHAAAGFNYYLVFGDSHIYKYDGSTWLDVTRTGAATLAVGDEFLWTMCELGAIDVASNSTDYPQYFSPKLLPEKFLDLPWSASQTFRQATKQCKAIRSHKNFLFALNLTESGVDYPNSYRWSDPAANNGVPSNWDETVIGSLAGKAEILGGGGIIVDGGSIRDAFCIYSNQQIDILDYTGDAFVWQSRKLSDSTGLLTVNCIANIFNAHVFLSDGDIILNDGNSLRSILTRRMRSLLNGTIDTDYYHRSFAVSNPKTKEVWICIPETGSSTPTLAFVYNWLTDKVSLRRLNKAYSSLTFGPVSITKRTWDNISNSWDNATLRWNTDVTSPFTDNVVAVENPTGKLYVLSNNDGTINYDTVLERLSFAIVDEQTVVSVKSIYPKMTSIGPVKIELGAKDYHGAPTRWQEPVMFNPNLMRKVDIRSTGKLHCWRISSVGAFSFSMTGMDIEYEVNGVR